MDVLQEEDYFEMEKLQNKTRTIVLDSNKSFEDLLLQSNEISSIHQKHLRKLTMEIYKRLTDLSPVFQKLFFITKEIQYNLRIGPILNLPLVRNTYYRINSFFTENAKYEINYGFPKYKVTS